MEQNVRNRLRNTVAQCRTLLENAVREVLDGQFAIRAAGKKGDVQVEEEARLTHLSDEDRQCRGDLLAHLGHIQALGCPAREALAQLIREAAFTHLNRLCAYKMMESRGLIREAVSRGVNSNGFKFYLADHPEDERLYTDGQQDLAYRHFLRWLGGTLSDEIGVLFSPHDPANRLFPPRRVLDEVLGLINSEELGDVWSEDEAIGWVYQYFTPKELRDQARKESQAPRNSYELAFRNQFFTPRYVVEFLTDNTLGRTWYEMRRGKTVLKERCRYLVRRPAEVFLAEGEEPPGGETEPTETQPSEDLLHRPVYVPHRPKKDPRDIKVLDPACGSGHFLLYCFDLLEVIYDEAYDDPDVGEGLRRDYTSRRAFRRAVPGLILAENLHGIDIDLRATQIAALALWLRAQRAYQGLGLKRREDRPRITRSNLVCAEPMPGERAEFEAFLRGLRKERLESLMRGVVSLDTEKRVRATESMAETLCELVRLVWDRMELAGEAGGLLRIETDLQQAIQERQEEWEDRYPLFRITVPSLTEQAKESYYRFVPGDVEGERLNFWDLAEQLVVAALREYAGAAEAGDGLQRQLFAEDAARGFGFIDVCRWKFDVVLMNPPFGAASKPSKAYIEQAYPRTKNDVYAAFVERGLGLLHRGGLLGAITSRTGFFLTSFQEWRKEILLREARPTVFADLGYGVLDTAMVETAAYCLKADAGNVGSIFVRLLKTEDKPRVLAGAVEALRKGGVTAEVFTVEPGSFEQVPGSPFAYWVSEKIRGLWSNLQTVDSSSIRVYSTNPLNDDVRYFRCWWEVPCGCIGRHSGWARLSKHYFPEAL